MSEFKKGDSVTWETGQGKTIRKVVKNQTTPTKIKGHEVKASTSNPEYIVESQTSGKRAAHKPGGLSRT